MKALITLSLILLASTIGPAMAEVTVHVKFKYNNVRAHNPKDLIKKLDLARTPLKGDAYAWVHSETKNHTTVEQFKDSCRLLEFDSDVHITINLPRWINVEKQRRRHQKWWKRLEKFMVEHEHLHKQIIIDAAKDFQAEAMQIGPQPDCEAVKTKYFALKEKYAQQIKDQDYKLDVIDGGRAAFRKNLFLDNADLKMGRSDFR